jgi:hypothetical protein
MANLTRTIPLFVIIEQVNPGQRIIVNIITISHPMTSKLPTIAGSDVTVYIAARWREVRRIGVRYGDNTPNPTSGSETLERARALFSELQQEYACRLLQQLGKLLLAQ